MNAFPFHVDPRDTSSDKDELAIQVGFRSKMRILAPRVMLFGIPNAGRRSAWETMQRGREGLVPGFPDMGAIFDGRVVFLEFKTGTGALSNQQIDTLNRLVSLNIPVGVFRSAESAVAWLEGHWPSAFMREAA